MPAKTRAWHPFSFAEATRRAGWWARALAGLLSLPASAQPQPAPSAATDQSELIDLAQVAIDGRPQFLWRDPVSAQWFVFSLDERGQYLATASRCLTAISPRSHDRLVLVLTEGGVILVNPVLEGGSDRNLSVELQGSTIEGSATLFVSADGLVYLAGLDAAGHLVLYYQSDVDVWVYRDLVAGDQVTVPPLQGELISYVTTWNGLNIAGLDQNGHIWVAWWAPGLPSWQGSDLSVITGAPALAGPLTAYTTPWGGINVAGLNASGEIVVVWWVPGFEGHWALNNLTAESGHAGLTHGSLTSYVTPWGGLNIGGLGVTGALTAYWWVPGFSTWAITSLSAQVPGGPSMGTGLTGLVSPQGTISVFGITPSGHIARYHWRPGAAWSAENITAAALPRAVREVLLFEDDFSVSGRINEAVWTTPHGFGNNNPAFFGRTALQNWLEDFQQEILPVANGAAILTLKTHNPHGHSFYGCEIDTLMQFQVETGLGMEARVWIDPAIPSGVVTSVFMYNFRDGLHDEVDFESLSRQYLANPSRIDMNVYADEPLGAGHPTHAEVAGLVQPEQWNVFRINWFPDRVEWLVNGGMVQVRTDIVPSHAMNCRLNIWVPGQEWAEAYDAALQPTSIPSENRVYECRVDYVRVFRITPN